MCQVFGVAPSRYYDWQRKQQSVRAKQDADQNMRDAFKK